MSKNSAKVKRVLHIKIRCPSSDMSKLLTTMMTNAALLYRGFGDVRIRLLQNADDQTRFIQVIEYEVEQTLELGRHQLASDPTTLNLVQALRSLFPGAAEVDIYEDVTNGH